MIMTPEEQRDFMDLIKQSQKLHDQKNELIETILYTAKAVAIENEGLRAENELLKRQLAIAENHIARSSCPK